MSIDVLSPELSRRILDMIDQDRDVTAETLSIQLNVPIELLEPIFVDVEKKATLSRTHLEVLQDNLVKICECVDIAEAGYKTIPNDRMAAALTALLQTQQMLISEIESRKDNKALLLKITKQVIQPLLTQVIKSLTEEMRIVRTTLCNEVPSNSHPVVVQVVNRVLEDFGVHVKDQYGSTVDVLAELLNVKVDG